MCASVYMNEPAANAKNKENLYWCWILLLIA